MIKFKANTYSYKTAADTFDSILGIFYLILVVSFPIYCLLFFTFNSAKLKKKDISFVEEYKEVFESTKDDNFWSLNYNVFFMIRRDIFTLVCIYWGGSFSIFQLIYAVVDSMIFLIYLVNFRPHKKS